MIDLSQGLILNILLTIFILTLAIFVRYLVLAGLFYYIFNGRYASRMVTITLNKIPGKQGQIRREILYSLVTSFIFALIGTMVFYSWQTGGTSIYLDSSLYPKLWLILSIVMVLIFHETYYYWLHRWMHRPSIYRWIHRTHHESLTTTAWTSFSFHPVESLLQALPIVLAIYVVPMHIISLVVLLLIMAITSVINHLNHEIYPAGSHQHWFGKWWIGATHHALHHSQFRFNFGLYFTFWDHWMKTESPDFFKKFEEKTTKDEANTK